MLNLKIALAVFSLCMQPVVGARYFIEDLQASGIEPLSNAALEALAVGNSWHLRNETTGRHFEVTFYAGGIRLFKSVASNSLQDQFQDRLPPDGIAEYTIGNTHILTTLGGKSFQIQVYSVDGKYVAYRSGDAGTANWTLLQRRPIDQSVITQSSLASRNIKALNSTQLRMLLSDQQLLLRHRATNEMYVAAFHADGSRSISNVTLRRNRQDLNTASPRLLGTDAKWNISDGRLVTSLNGNVFSAKVYSVDGNLLAARNIDLGRITWELVYLE